MNKQRRKELSELQERIQKLIEEAEGIKNALEDIAEEEEDYRDNIPENLYGSERYEQSEEASENMEDAMSSLDDAIDALNSAYDSTEEAIG